MLSNPEQDSKFFKQYLTTWFNIGLDNPIIIKFDDPPFTKDCFYESISLKMLIAGISNSWSFGEAASYKDHCIIFIESGTNKWLYIKGDTPIGVYTEEQLIILLHQFESLDVIIKDLLTSDIKYWSSTDIAHIINQHFYKTSVEDIQASLDKHNYSKKLFSGITHYSLIA